MSTFAPCLPYRGLFQQRLKNGIKLFHDTRRQALKRAIYTGRVAGYQAKRDDEMQAVADALSHLANLVMGWNTTQMQLILDRWNNQRREQVPLELIGRIAPTRIEGINLRGVFRFPIERFAAQILPSASTAKTTTNTR
jgi:hypothetical protein